MEQLARVRECVPRTDHVNDPYPDPNGLTNEDAPASLGCGAGRDSGWRTSFFHTRYAAVSWSRSRESNDEEWQWAYPKQLFETPSSLERPLSRQDENVDSHWMPRSIGGAERRLASDSDKNPFAFCPIDIVREIFEIAARNATADACTLSLVSRDTRQWVNPFLYQTLVITKPGHIEAIITNSLSLPGSSQFLAQHVHYLAFVWAENSTISMWDDEVIQGIAWLLRACKNIRSLLADFFHLQRVTNLMVTLPHLRRIHCLDAKPSLSKLGEAEITHLYVRVAPPWDLYTYAHIDEWAIPLRLPPRVSHLGFHIRISLDGDAWPSMLLSFVSHILESSNISRLVITLTFFDHEDRRRLLVPESHPFTDPRLCLLLNGFGGTQRADVARDWETEARGGRGVWDRESEGKPGAIIEV